MKKIVLSVLLSSIVGGIVGSFAGPLAATLGGTGQSSYTTGDLLYASSSTALSKLAATTSGYVLTSNGSSSAPSWQAAAAGGGTTQVENGFRLSVATGDPIPMRTGTSSTTLYCVPYVSNVLWTYDSSTWTRHTSSEFSLALGTLTSGKCYDVFVYNNSGTLTLVLSAAWSSDTARSDAIAQQDGVWVKSSDHSRRLLGTIYTISTTQVRDAPEARYVSNLQNTMPVMDQSTGTDATQTWTIQQSGYTQMNSADTSWFFDYVSCLGDYVYAEAEVLGQTDGSGTVYTAIGVDSATTKATRSIGGWNNTTTRRPMTCRYGGNPGIGKHRIEALNGSDSAGRTMTLQSNAGVGALDGAPYGITYQMAR